ncbi:FAD:protein FMN transferase [Shewanella xiamenensis]|uniref:FAD:protein FMN transferase n=1 Tax=Shewanella xiamenensis TaxID=332186 RepID=UPI00166AD7D7|nr:FAD:protein FMN transferase [Shewanella xiamenensis]MCL1069081.1 FAD:protein FMN transferase [Shewanella xiamenensis]GGM80645.1 FAD:protein FMN transferase [Shewanella xiamenensis]
MKYLLSFTVLIYLFFTPTMANATFSPFDCNTNATFNYEHGKGSMNTLKYFGTSITIDIYEADKNKAYSALCHALNVVQEYHYLASNFSTYPGYTNIQTINNNPEQLHHIDAKLTELLATSIEWHGITQGRFNVALAPVLEVWRSYRKRCQQVGTCELPSDIELANAAKHIDIKQIKLDVNNNTIQMKSGMKLDLGGIAKGWMVEKVYDQLKADNITAFMINAGGNIRHFGTHPDGRQFITAIENPLIRKYQLEHKDNIEINSGDIYHEIIQGEDITIVSSGNYLNYYTVDGQEYHHIIDPTTLYPKKEGISVSVIMKNNPILADVISTSLFLLPMPEAQALIKRIGDIEAVWFLDEQGNKIATPQFEQYRAKFNP